MSDAVQLALITAISGMVTGVISTIGTIIINKVNKVQKTVNGRLDEYLRRTERAEKISPGITTIPEHMETRSVLSVNDPSNDNPPMVKVTETKLSSDFTQDQPKV